MPYHCQLFNNRSMLFIISLSPHETVNSEPCQLYQALTDERRVQRGCAIYSGPQSGRKNTVKLISYIFQIFNLLVCLGQGFLMQLRLTINSLYSPVWP